MIQEVCMMLLLQMILYCLLFVLLIKCAAKNSGLNCLYFYSKEYIDEAHKRGIADKNATMKKGKRFMVPFCMIMLVVLVAIISFWNHITDFKTAYIQSYLFLVVMNWFDGIVIDKFWVSHGKIWVIEGMEGVPYTNSWKHILIKRSFATIAYLLIALVVAGIVVLIGRV